LAQSETKTLTFQERLHEQFEMLTSNDLLIAEMLVDGLSTKQISLELNISPASANTARYRLRKKMNLSPETDLVTYLQEI
jgi:DNA-binding NarL/FixJ family response regulator